MINLMFWYSTYSQAKIESVLSDIREILYGGNSILLDECGKLAYHLIAVRGLVDCSTVIDDCKCALLQLLSKGNYDARKITLVMGMYGSAKFWTDEQKSEYSDFINEIKDTIKKHDIEPISKQCSVENFANMLDSLCNEKEKYISQHAFFSRVNVDQWIELLPQLSSDQIYKLRETLDYIYSFSNIKDFFSTDKESLIYFKNGVESVIGSDVIKDKILKLQYKFLLDDLTSIIGKL